MEITEISGSQQYLQNESKELVKKDDSLNLEIFNNISVIQWNSALILIENVINSLDDLIYNNGIVYGSGVSIDYFFPKLIPKKNSIIYLGYGEYSLFDTKSLRSLGGGGLVIPNANLNIYQVGNLYDFNYVNSSVCTYDSFGDDFISVINQNPVTIFSQEIQYRVSETGGELNNTGLNISRPISDAYSLSSVNYCTYPLILAFLRCIL